MTDEPDTTGITVASVMVVLFADVYRLLVERGTLTQGDAIARLERLSREVAALADNAGLAVSLVDTVRDTIANELDRRPS